VLNSVNVTEILMFREYGRDLGLWLGEQSRKGWRGCENATSIVTAARSNDRFVLRTEFLIHIF
jgi:hypothetical protein